MRLEQRTKNKLHVLLLHHIHHCSQGLSVLWQDVYNRRVKTRWMCTLVFDTYRVAVPRLESCMQIFSLELEYRHISRAKVKCVVRDEEIGGKWVVICANNVKKMSHRL